MTFDDFYLGFRKPSTNWCLHTCRKRYHDRCYDKCVFVVICDICIQWHTTNLWVLKRWLFKDKTKKYLPKFFNFTFIYIDDVLSLNNPYFSQYLNFIYSSELEMEDTPDTRRTASYFNLFPILTQMDDFTLKYMSNDFNFPIINFPFVSSNIPSVHRMVFTYRSWYVMLVHFHTILVYGLHIQPCAPYAETNLRGKIKYDSLQILWT